MANTLINIREILDKHEATADIDGKFLAVQTHSDGYTGTVAGTYVYSVVKSGADYKVAQKLYDHETDTFTDSDAPVIMTEGGDTIFYITRTTKDPYNFPIVNEVEVQTGEVLEKQILQAFLAFAEDEFKFGVYNVFLADDPQVLEVTP